MNALDTLNIAINRLQSSVKNMSGVYNFVAGVAAQVQELDNAILAMDNRLRGLIPADADGPSWLQQLAKFLGTNRGSDETDARAIEFLEAQVVSNSSWGGIGDVQAIANVLYGASFFALDTAPGTSDIPAGDNIVGSTSGATAHVVTAAFGPRSTLKLTNVVGTFSSGEVIFGDFGGADTASSQYPLDSAWISDGGDEPSAPPTGLATWGTGTYCRIEPVDYLAPVTLSDFNRCRVQLQKAKPAGVRLTVGGIVGEPGTALFQFDRPGAGFDSATVFYTLY